MRPDQMKTIHRVISTFGERNQKMQTLEELLELQSALFENVHRGTDNRANIVEEVADVEVMLIQLKQIFNISTLDNYSIFIASRHFQTINDFINLELVNKKCRGIRIEDGSKIEEIDLTTNTTDKIPWCFKL